MLTIRRMNFIDAASGVVTLSKWPSGAQVERELLSSTGLLSRGQGPEGPATGHLDAGFSWFSCVHEHMLRWYPRCQVATTCFSCSPPRPKFGSKSYIYVN